jgi:hypothetical protein
MEMIWLLGEIGIEGRAIAFTPSTQQCSFTAETLSVVTFEQG